MTFDTLKMVRKFLAADFNRKQAEALTEGMQDSQAELVTKADIATLKYQLLLGNAALLGVAVTVIVALIKLV